MQQSINGLAPQSDTYRKRLWILVLILFAAAFSRLASLTLRSLDGDEGISLLFSELPYSVLLRHVGDLTLDRHPLSYYIILKLWRDFVGDTDLELRLLSVLIGIVTVALVYQIGRRKLGHLRAAFAALLVAMNPLIVYQDQYIRMYAPALLLTAVAFYIIFAARPKTLWSRLLTYLILVGAVVAAVYFHVLAVTIIPILGVLLLWQARRRPAESAMGMAALAVSGLGILPYISNIFMTGNQGGGSLALEGWYRTLVGEVKTLLDYQSVLTFTANERLLLIVLVLILVVAIYRDRQMGTLFSVWLLGTLVLGAFVSLRIEFFTSKILTFGVIPFSYILATAFFGKAAAVDRRGLLPALLVIGLMLAGQWQMARPGNQREDFRSAAQFVEQYATSNDAVFIHLNWYRYVFGHYYPRPFFAPFANNISSEEEVRTTFEPYLDSEVIWLVQSGTDAPTTGLPDYIGDQGRAVQGWLGERFPASTAVFPNGVEVYAFSANYRFTTLPETAVPLNLAYPNGLRLVGYRVAQTEFPTKDYHLHPPSTWVPVTLYWSVDRPLEFDMVPSIALEDEQGNLWGGELSRENGLPAFYPPTSWQPGEIVRWDFDVNVNPELTSGDYKLVLRVQSPPDAAPINHEGGESWHILDRVTFQDAD